MAKLRAHNISMSLDGYAAGSHQSIDSPMGIGGEALHSWFYPTRIFRAMQGLRGGTEAVDNDVAARADVGIGATIMGRNMFGPIRGPWGESEWSGWWGENPPFHHPVFVLTHFAHPAIEMAGGTTFHFVTDGIESAREQAIDAAQGLDVRVGGGAQTLRQYMSAGLLDELHCALVPELLGRGERLFETTPPLSTPRYRCREMTMGDQVCHLSMVLEH